MVILNRFVVGPETCEYLPEQQSRQRYEIVAGLTPEAYEQRMNAGWRKFGVTLFRPICPRCQACRPIRILADRFAPDRSQRRTLKRNADLTVHLARPTVDVERLALYTRYHRMQAERKGWPERDPDIEEYYGNFVLNPLPAVEISVRENGLLRAIVLNEMTPNTLSAIYHYHDPDSQDRSLGTFAILQAITLAQSLGKPYAYLGFYVAGCGSMAYKARYRPCEILGTDGVWRDLETSS